MTNCQSDWIPVADRLPTSSDGRRHSNGDYDYDGRVLLCYPYVSYPKDTLFTEDGKLVRFSGNFIIKEQ